MEHIVLIGIAKEVIPLNDSLDYIRTISYRGRCIWKITGCKQASGRSLTCAVKVRLSGTRPAGNSASYHEASLAKTNRLVPRFAYDIGRPLYLFIEVAEEHEASRVESISERRVERKAIPLNDHNLQQDTLQDSVKGADKRTANMVDVHELTIAQVHDAFQKGTYSCKDLTAAYLDRIQTLDKSGPRIYSTMAMSTTALDEAAALDVYFQEHGKPKGRLHGIPVLIKDQADTKGIETRYGSMAVKGNVPTEDAFVVTKLKGEGAIVLGKTTMAEWATTWFSASSATNWEFTHNPYKIDYDVGGSSGGSAAAVAANFAMLGLAEDTVDDVPSLHTSLS